MSKFAFVQTSDCIVSPRRHFRRIKSSYPVALTFYEESGNPLAVASDVDSLESGLIVMLTALIGHVLQVGAWTKVVLSVIQGVTVLVIYLSPVSYFHNISRQGNLYAFGGGYPYRPKRFEASRLGVPMSVPTKLRDSFKVFRIDDGILSLCKWDQAVGWIKRLDNGMPRGRFAGHVLTSNENVLPAVF